MKLTPLDIRKQEFDRSLRGFDTREVRHFLDIVATQWDELTAEHRRLEEKVRDLENKLEHYERVEEALQEALQTARENAEQKIANAEREAAAIVKEAEADARALRQEAREERDDLRRHTQKIDDRRGEIVARLRSFLMAEMELLARFEGDDPIGFIKLLPNEAREKLREAGKELEQIPPHFEEVGESAADTAGKPAGRDVLPGTSDAHGGAETTAEAAGEERMTAEEENELAAFFEEFDSEAPADAAPGDDAAPSVEADAYTPPEDDVPPVPEPSSEAIPPESETAFEQADAAPVSETQPASDSPTVASSADDTHDEPSAPSAATEEREDTTDEEEAAERQRDFRVHSILSADASPSHEASSERAMGDVTGSGTDAAKDADGATDEDDAADQKKPSAPSEEIERIRRILKNME